MQPIPAVTEPASDSVDAFQVTAVPATGGKSYGQILRSSALIGGSSVVNIAIGIIRTKAMAILLGPAGVGLMGVYLSILDLAQSITGLGINTSGVRQIAEAAGSGETGQVARTATVLRRTAIVLGLTGALCVLLFSKQIAIFTFGDYRNTAGVAALSLALFFSCIAGGQGALIQGMRRISDLAKLGIIGGVSGTFVSIVLVYFFREKGIVPSLVAGAAMAVLTSWWYSRKIDIQPAALTSADWRRETSALLKLGVVFSGSAILTMGAAYAVRLIVLRKVGVEAAGFYQSAWTIGGLYAGFILQAMLTDFYPRLTAVAKDDRECNRLVNEQAEIGLLLAGPGVLATITFAPLVIALFYSGKFAAAIEPLRWICVGMILRVIAWPMGFIVVAKGIQTIFLWTEVAATIVHIGLAFVLVSYFGLVGAAIAFFGLYVWHGILINLIVRRISGFHWSVANRQNMMLFLPTIALIFGAFHWLPFWLATGLGGFTVLTAGIYSLRMLTRLVTMDRLPRFLRQILSGLRISPAS